MAQEKDYVLGTHDEEIARLGLQHRVWRPRVLQAWREAGFTAGQRVVDVGCGPGYATLDLAEIVGPQGGVVSIDRSRRFLDALEATVQQRGLAHVSAFEQDLDEGSLPTIGADGAWCRWVFAFVKDPRRLLGQIHAAVRPGGRVVFLEYLHYCTWRLIPRALPFERFVDHVVRTWRESGGEPDIGACLPLWMGEDGWRVDAVQPVVEIVGPEDYVWEWPKAFVYSGVNRLVGLGEMTQTEGDEAIAAWENSERTPGTRVVTPLVAIVTATRL